MRLRGSGAARWVRPSSTYSSDALAGLRALLDRWKAVALSASTVDEALAHIDAEPDVAHVDYHLHDWLDDLGVIAELRRRGKRDLPAALLTGDGAML